MTVSGCTVTHQQPPSVDGGECDGGTAPGLVDPRQWRSATTPDPLEGHRPDPIECSPIAGWYPEGDALEVDTARCNYVDVYQPVGVSTTGRRRLQGSITHFDLVAPEPATAHVAVLLEHRVVWEREVVIPGPADAFDLDVPLGAPACGESELRLHLHNHGQNTWLVGPLFVSDD